VSVDVRLTDLPLDPAAALAAAVSPADGAGLLFVGVVRAENEGRPVLGVRYDAYQTMAERVLRDIAGEAATRLGSDRLAVHHRTGELAVGEASVLVAVASPHRAEAFDAARYVIDEIKRRLPVWKQERYADGDVEWLDGADPVAEIDRHA
jgi:molybdopterin synthase catalytic subunit